ncbi:hypothetical protein [Pseudalkalibacillus decolorationis]|uniref:hypothetical protein n=1 Tax=Pseudalkalibacillus decolorationis TaxID=163879 RepID=UPI002147AC2B|nr:hypothetical protein [Pseudalkalibacillus decolorationis]
MKKWKRPSKWVLVGVLSILFILVIGGWTSLSLLKDVNDEKASSLAEAKELGKVRAASSETIFVNSDKEGEIHAEIGQMHNYLNDLLGWGAWQSVNPDKMQEELETKHNYIVETLVPETKGTLKKDLLRAANGIQKALETNKVKSMFDTHRIFHDLDVVMNDIVVEDYWGVTETFGATSP